MIRFGILIGQDLPLGLFFCSIRHQGSVCLTLNDVLSKKSLVDKVRHYWGSPCSYF